jgi:hypothetical protein
VDVTRRPSLITDDLLRQLMAAGQADLLVGVPTLDNASTIEGVLYAIHQAIADGLADHRVLILNSDGGSSDATQALVAAASRSRAATLLASHSLRTLHRIVAPYHGLPGKRAAIRTVFAAADLLQTRAVAIVDPAATTPDAAALLALFGLGLRAPNDFVASCPVRDPREAPLITQVVRPLIAAAFGASFEDPLGGEFVASAAFVADALRQPVWDNEHLRPGIDLWLRVHALAGPFTTVQVHTPARVRESTPAQPALRTIVQQVLAATWASLDTCAARWMSGVPVALPTTVTRVTADSAAPPTWDVDGLARSCREAVHDLEPLWRRILPDPICRSLRTAVAHDPLALDDALWADILVEYAAAWRRGRSRADDLAASFVPLYLGRAATYLHGSAALDPAAARGRLDALTDQLRARRARLVEAWRLARPGGS